MLPRNNISFLLVNFMLLLYFSLPVQGQDKPHSLDKSSSKNNMAIRFYSTHISPVIGDRCGMIPSCSSYADQAITKHGFLMGWIMANDRLIRCGRDEKKISPNIIKKKRKYILDPVSANDFWWFKQKDRQ